MTNEAQGGVSASRNGNGSLVEELLTVHDVARATHRTPAAVRAAIARGDIPAHKLGSCRYFIRRSDLLRMFDQVPARRK